MSTFRDFTKKLTRRPGARNPAPAEPVEQTELAGVDEAQVRDDPIIVPGDDLLGMDFYAQHLVDYVMKIRPPFTVGIYGEWGAGKTSLVQLLHHHVETREPGSMHFIVFSAWRYKTADELWRALILTIAQTLYHYDPSAPARAAPVPPIGDRFRQYLQGSAWGGDESEPIDTNKARYEAIAKRLDVTLYGGIARGRNAQSQMTDQDMMVAGLKVATSALESVSPFFATVGKLFGLDEKIEFGKMLHEEKNEATRNRIESIEHFRNEMRTMFREAGNKRVCVFIDDLDRVMPDVALDLMEAIRSLLDCVNCTFIVAADQQLIGQGLKARFRELDASAGQPQADFFEKKGREYFEKIVQLGIPVPEPSMEEAHRFIAAQFPSWAAASDLLVSACGTNPRRLKQYCVLADYRLAVWKKQQEHEPKQQEHEPKIVANDAELRSQLIALHARRPDCLGLIVRMTSAPHWRERMTRLEKALDEFENPVEGHARDSAPSPNIMLEKALLDDEDCDALYRSVYDSKPARVVFQTPPRFSDADPKLVGALARFADVRPGPDGNLVSRDRVFTRIFEKAVKQPIPVDELLREDFTRMAAVPSAIFDALALVAADEGWPDQMDLIERQLQSGATDVVSTLLPAAQELLRMSRPLVPDEEVNLPPSSTTAIPGGETRSVSVLLQGTVRFSTMLCEEVLAFAKVRNSLPAAETLVKTKTLSEPERQRTQAQKAMSLLAERHPQDLDDLRRWLELRIKAAKHYVELRSFLKLEALRMSWSGLTGYLSERSSLLELESLAQSGKADDAILGRLSSYRNDPRLMRFLRQRPWLKDMSPGQLKAYVTTSSAADATPTPTALPVTSVPVKDAPAEEATFKITMIGNEANVELALRTHRYSSLIAAERVNQIEAIARIGFEEWQDGQRAAAIGRTLFETAFPPDLSAPLLEALRVHPRIRLWIESGDPKLVNLPWEAMFVGQMNGFLAAQGCSIVRWHTPRRPTPRLRFDRPLRILAVFSNPSATAPLNVAAEMEVLRQTCAAAQEANLVHLTVIPPEEATRERLREAIRAIQPQVFHFTGHGVYDADKKEGALVVGEGRDGLDLMFANQVGTLISNNGVLLTLLNSCDTGTSGNNAAVTGVAGTLVGQGIPAVVATIRQVMDQAATMFTKNFYSAIVAGESVEAAMYQTRTALEIDRQDWSVYALYASARDLDHLVADIPRRRASEIMVQS